jgi:DMSO/TMAO reductase YedYZ heme-binding membrane subunit
VRHETAGVVVPGEGLRHRRLVDADRVGGVGRRFSPAVWRGIHLTSYVVFWLTSIHAALAGSDTTNRLYQATAIAATMAVAWALMCRITNRGRRRRAVPKRRAQSADPVSA